MSTHGSFNTKSPTIKRILREAAELSGSPSADFHAAPLESNLFEWHFTIRGPPAPSPFENGLYHGRIVLPPTYPLRPPSFRFLTPSGRFEPNREICLSISGHHEESWQPAWGIRTALVAIRSFMDSEAKGQLGGIESGPETRKSLAAASGAFRCPGCGGRTNAEIMKECEELAAQAEGGPVEEKVPEELKLGYRDELGKAKDDTNIATPGPVPTVPSAGQVTSPESGITQPAQPPQTIRIPITTPSDTVGTTATSSSPAVAQPIPVITHPTPTAQQQQILTTQTQSSGWLDMAIIGIAVALGIMVIRKVLTITA